MYVSAFVLFNMISTTFTYPNFSFDRLVFVYGQLFNYYDIYLYSLFITHNKVRTFVSTFTLSHFQLNILPKFHALRIENTEIKVKSWIWFWRIVVTKSRLMSHNCRHTSNYERKWGSIRCELNFWGTKIYEVASFKSTAMDFVE